MAIPVWIGTDPGNVGDWGTAANWSTASVPVDSDTVQFNAGSTDVTSGLDQNAIGLTLLMISQDYTGNIGSSGSPLIIGSAKTRYDGGGDLFLSSTATDAQTDVDITNTRRKTVELTSAAAGFTNTSIKNGPVTFVSGTFTTVFVEDVPGNLPIIDADTATITTLRLFSGQFSNTGAATVTNLHLSGSAKATIQNGTLTNVEIHSSAARLFWETSTTLTSAILWHGLLDASRDQAAKTITTLAMHNDSIADLDNLFDNITVTTLNTYGHRTSKKLGKIPGAANQL